MRKDEPTGIARPAPRRHETARRRRLLQMPTANGWISIGRRSRYRARCLACSMKIMICVDLRLTSRCFRPDHIGARWESSRSPIDGGTEDTALCASFADGDPSHRRILSMAEGHGDLECLGAREWPSQLVTASLRTVLIAIPVARATAATPPSPIAPASVPAQSRRARSSMVAFSRRHFWRTDFSASTSNVDHAKSPRVDPRRSIS